MADTITTTEEEKQPKQYESLWNDDVLKAQHEYEQQKEADDARIQQLSKGRDYWVGANMLANALGNLINVYGTVNGAPAMQMPDMDNSYMKVWRESDEIRRANRQRMKDRYDRLRVAQLQDESRHNATVEGRQYAEQQRLLAEEKTEKELQERITALKANNPTLNLTDEQWRAWAKDDKFMPDEVRKTREQETFDTQLAQRKAINKQNTDAELAKETTEIKKIKNLYPAEANVTDDEAWSIYKGYGYSPRLHKWLTDNGYQTQSFNKRKGTVSYGVDSNGKKNNDLVIKGNDDYEDFVIKGSDKAALDANRGKLSSIIQNVVKAKFPKPAYDKKKHASYNDYKQEEAIYNSVMADLTDLKKGATIEKLNRIIDDYGLLEDDKFVEELNKLAGNDVETEVGDDNTIPGLK